MRVLKFEKVVLTVYKKERKIRNHRELREKLSVLFGLF